MTGLLVWLHLVAVVFWVGGIFFVQVALRPALGHLESTSRLKMIDHALARYFAGVGLCIVLIFGSGFAMMLRLGGAAGPWAVPPHVHAMLGLALLMTAMYAHTMAGPFRRLRRAVAAQDWDGGAAAMARIRLQGLSNLLLGVLTMAVATLGRGHG